MTQRRGRHHAPGILAVAFLLSASAGLLHTGSVLTTHARPQAAEDWPKLIFSAVASGLNQPSYITHAGDGTGRLFIVELPGTIQILADGALLPEPFLDITDRVLLVETGHGMHSAVFPPDYASKGYFYVYYTNLDGDIVVSRYHVSADNPNRADAFSEEFILTIDHPYPATLDHWGGQLAFGPDGYLYLAPGDGDAPGYAQDPMLLLGKILRLDVESPTEGSYVIPPTNPFVGDPGVRPEVWALGLRNPWRISFDRATGDLFIADVGEHEREEIDFQPASSPGGENYGWDIMEGSLCFQPPSGCDPTGLTLPVWEYDHSVGCSVTGGFVHHGNIFAGMRGIYFYGDFCSGVVWGLKRGSLGWENRFLADTAYNITTFGEDEAGNTYVANFANGKIYQLAELLTPETVMRSIGILLNFRTSDPARLVIGHVFVRDQQAGPVPDALVEATWTSPSGATRSTSAVTNSLGVARFTQLGGAGTYTLRVDSVSKTGFFFDFASSLLTASTTVP